MQQTQTFSMTVTPPGDFTLSLIGGWRLQQPYCKGGLAIDFATMRAWTLGHAQTVNLAGYDLPAMGTGTSYAAWPQVNQARDYGSPYTVAGWSTIYGNQLYAAGLMWRDGKLWMSGKGFYASGGSFPSTVVKKFTLSGSTATLAETVTLSGRPMQAFGGGFVKGHPDGVLLGCGGYESGQGSRSGPCWMTLGGTVVNEFPVFDAPKELREKRPNNYSCAASQWFVPPDGSVGYWFAGEVVGGGLVVGGKACFWSLQGTGYCGYELQSPGFGTGTKQYLYRYGPGEHFGSHSEFATPGGGPVIGQEISADSTRVYLLVREAWSDGWDPMPAVACYEVGP
jgi:hypothetical protein